MKKFIKNTVNSIRANAIRLAATYRSGEGYIDTAVKILIAVVLGALLLAGLYDFTSARMCSSKHGAIRPWNPDAPSKPSVCPCRLQEVRSDGIIYGGF